MLVKSQKSFFCQDQPFKKGEPPFDFPSIRRCVVSSRPSLTHILAMMLQKYLGGQQPSDSFQEALCPTEHGSGPHNNRELELLGAEPKFYCTRIKFLVITEEAWVCYSFKRAMRYSQATTPGDGCHVLQPLDKRTRIMQVLECERLWYRSRGHVGDENSIYEKGKSRAWYIHPSTQLELLRSTPFAAFHVPNPLSRPCTDLLEDLRLYQSFYRLFRGSHNFRWP